jgi:hypothetical protein
MKLSIIRFNWKTERNESDLGFIAHEIQEIIPEAVLGEKDATYLREITPAVLDEDDNIITEAVTEETPDLQQVDTSKVIPLLVAAVQELSTKVTALENA